MNSLRERKGKRIDIVRWQQNRLRRLRAIETPTQRQRNRAHQLANTIQIAWAKSRKETTCH